MRKDLNIRPETIKLLEENICKTLSNINHNRILYDPLLRVSEIKTKINKWDLIKLKGFCTTKETISNMFFLIFIGQSSSIHFKHRYNVMLCTWVSDRGDVSANGEDEDPPPQVRSGFGTESRGSRVLSPAVWSPEPLSQGLVRDPHRAGQ